MNDLRDFEKATSAVLVRFKAKQNTSASMGVSLAIAPGHTPMTTPLPTQCFLMSGSRYILLRFMYCGALRISVLFCYCRLRRVS